MNTTYEEASRCPKCDTPGKQVKSEPGSKRSTIYILNCVNERCTWYNTGWQVQVMEDGSVPIRTTTAKTAEPLSEEQKAYARRYLEDIAGRDLREELP